MFKNRIAIAAGSSVAALLAQILPSRGMPVDLPGAPRRSTRSVAGRLTNSRAPKLKRPRTPADFDAIMRAEQKRQRKAAQLTRDSARQAFSYCRTRDGAIAAEAIAVHDQLVA